MFSTAPALERDSVVARVRGFVMVARDRMPKFNFAGVPMAFALLCVYCLSAGLHYALLKPVSIAPYIAHDEVQYALLGENLRAGNGFHMRGQFHVTAPPLTPAFIAWSHGLAQEPRKGFFVASVLVICSLVFPLYFTGKRIGLGNWQALAAAAAGSFIPQTFYAGMYMSETLQLPLFCLSLWFMVAWLDRPRLGWSIAIGITFALMALNRIGGIVPVLCFYVVVIAWFARKRSGNEQALPNALSAVIPLIFFLVAQGWWLSFKSAAGVSLLGTYGSTATSAKLLTLEMFTVYATDMFLAAGLITGGCFLMGIAVIHRSNWRQSVLLLILPLTLVTATAFTDGNLTGFLRERYFIYAFPLMMMVAIRGIAPLSDLEPRWLGLTVLWAVPLACLFGLLLYTFPVPPLVESSWAHALGSTNGQFARQTLFERGLLLIAVSGVVLSVWRQHAPTLLCLFLIGWQVFAFGRVADGISAVTSSIAERTSVLTSLFPKQTKPLQRVLVAGSPPGFDERFFTRNDKFITINHSQVDDDLIWYLETLRLFDVRMCGEPSCVVSPDARGAYFLTTYEFPRLELVNKRRGFYLYRVPAEGTEPPTATPVWVPAKRFFSTSLTERMLKGEIAGKGNGQKGLLLQGPYLRLEAGAYTAMLDFTASPGVPYRAEIWAGNRIVSAVDSIADRFRPIDFVLTQSAPLDLRFMGANRSDLVVRGLTLTRRGGKQWSFARSEFAKEYDPDRFGTQFGTRTPDGAISGSAQEQAGYLAFGPYEKLAPGNYEVEFYLTGQVADPVTVDVFAAPDSFASAVGKPGSLPRLKFKLESERTVEFRVACKNHPSLKFRGVKLLSIEDYGEPAALPAAAAALAVAAK